MIEGRFREIVGHYTGAMRRLCSVYTRDPADREDLLQDIFLAVWRALPGFRGEASERTWLYRIAHNVALTWQATDRRIRDRRSGLDAALAHPTQPPNPQKAWLTETIALLPPVDRQLIGLSLEGLTMAEIEEVTGVRAGTVAVRLTRIRRKLAEAQNG